jgi:Flp pilus assembly protein TadD
MVGNLALAKRMGMRTLGLAAVLGVGLSMSACTKKTASLDADPLSTASTAKPGPSFKRTEALGKAWNDDPGNAALAIQYSKSLEELGQKDTQIDVLRTAVSRTGTDADAQGKLGRALLTAGDAEGAIAALQRSTEINPRDTASLSALGAALDQQTRHGDAREKYQAALALAPDDVGIMNNLAMSYALQGKLPDAEQKLRSAIAHPSAKNMPRIRQNLALVVGLQGRFDEAKKIASQDLPPDQVQANLDYLQKMLARPNTWAQLQDG